MKLAAMHLTQRDEITCGPAVAVIAGALLDPAYRRRLIRGDDEPNRTWFAGEQGRVHHAVNLVWPRRLGTTPMGVARAITVHSRRYGVRYRWRLCRGRRDALADVLAAVDARWPVAMLVGNLVPRHWVLLVDRDGPAAVRCYEPSSGEVRAVDLDAIRHACLTDVGFHRPFAFILPKAPYSNI